ncbi:MAG: hypothetical protein AAFW64_02510 [Pseudomonadota bacterium]
MDMYGPLAALFYLALQFSVFAWVSRPWRMAGQVPLWILGSVSVISVVLGALGQTDAALLLAAGLPIMTVYLACLCTAYVVKNRALVTA